MSDSAGKHAGPLKVLRWTAAITGFVLAGVVVKGLIDAGFGARQIVLVCFSALLCLIAMLGRLVGARVTLACSALVYPLLGILAWSPDLVLRRLAPVRSVDKPLNIHAPDRRYVYKHIPGATAIHESAEFKVIYTIDADGHRVTPTPKRSLGQIMLLGCSFVFGHGVDDNECLAHILGKEHWTRFKVRNHGVMGWGTTQAYLTVEDELTRGDPPRVVLYAWIRAHAMRSFLRKEALQGLNVPFPHYEVEEGRLVLKGYVAPEKGVKVSPELDKKEIELCAVQMREMHRLCKRRSVAFFVVFLSDSRGKPARSDYPSLIALLDRYEVPYIDLSELGGRMFHPEDEHPNREWHKVVASALASSPRIAPLLKE